MKLMCLLAFLLSFSSTTYASDDYRHEITGGLNLLGVLGSGASGSLDLGDGGEIFSLNGSYYYSFTDLISFGPTIGILATDGATFLTLLGGPRFNLLGPLPEALFISPSIGFLNASGGGVSSTDFAMNFAVGKRFPLAAGVSYSPNAGFYVVNDTFRFKIEFVAFSIVF